MGWLLPLLAVLLLAGPAHANRLWTAGAEEGTSPNAGTSTLGWNTNSCTFNNTSPHSGTNRYSCAGQTLSKTLAGSARTSGTLWTRMYVQFNSATPAAIRIFSTSPGNGGTDNWRLSLLTTGQIRLENRATSTTFDSTLVITANTWYRLAVKHTLSSTVGVLQLNIYVGDSLTLEEATLGATGGNTLSTAVSSSSMTLSFSTRPSLN